MGSADEGPDDVGRIAEAWRRERPDLDVSSIGVVTRLWHAAKLLGDDRRRTLAGAGADTAVLDLLGTLRRSGTPYVMTTRELTDRAGVTPGATSQRVARAERAGLVTRTPVPGTRSVEVTLTSAGCRVADELAGVVLAREVDLLSVLGPKEQEALADLLRTLIAGLHERLGHRAPGHVGGEPGLEA